jgi:hypothetical protein
MVFNTELQSQRFQGPTLAIIPNITKGTSILRVFASNTKPLTGGIFNQNN